MLDILVVPTLRNAMEVSKRWLMVSSRIYRIQGSGRCWPNEVCKSSFPRRVP